MPITKILVANRSEIAIRVFRAANELGLRTVAVWAEEDKLALHRFKADEAYLIGRGPHLDAPLGPIESYLSIPEIIRVARQSGADAIHPGYGLLSESPEFVDACAEAGITFIGPAPETMRRLGNKIAARDLAVEANVPVVPATEPLPDEMTEVKKLANAIGYPLMLKASWGGGGRGMRVIRSDDDLDEQLLEAKREAAAAFGKDEIYLEKLVERARHVEVQVLGDRHGTKVHLFERDCSVQRRNQKVVERAPAPYLSAEQREELCEYALRIARETDYVAAGTVEFLQDADTGAFYFIEVNPRIQVEHTVTEEITGIDIVKAQIRLVSGEKIGTPLDGEHGSGVPLQADIEMNGHALQCRITTEDPQANFIPDYGRITAYRGATGFGIRLDGGTAYSGAVITRFYDPLLEKVTAWAPTPDETINRMDRALREFRIRGVATNLTFLENIITHPEFRDNTYTTKFIDTHPELFDEVRRRDRATRLLNYIADVTVNGHPDTKGRRLPAVAAAPQAPFFDVAVQDGTKQKLDALGPEKFASWMREQNQVLVTDTTMRDGHQSLLATRIRTADIAAVAGAYSKALPNLLSLECWGGATFDVAMRFLTEDPWERLSAIRERAPNLLTQMLIRGANGVGYTNYADNEVEYFIQQAARNGMDLFRVFDCFNWLPNMRVSMDAVLAEGKLCEAVICYTGALTGKYDLKYYTERAEELTKAGAHIICIKDMAGLMRPAQARALFPALRDATDLPIHFHTHDTSGLAAATVLAAVEAGVDAIDCATDALAGGTSQPALGSVATALADTDRDPGLDLDAIRRISLYWEGVRQAYAAFEPDTVAPASEVYEHEMPGGQYTNLKEQARSMGLASRWTEVARTYADVNEMFGDIVKVTPSSKVVGDMALMMVSQGLTRAEVEDPATDVAFPDSVIAMMRGELSQPVGGFPEGIRSKVLKGEAPLADRAGLTIPAADLEAKRAEAEEAIGRPVTDTELASYLMYPKVFVDYARARASYGPVGLLPTPVFFYGMEVGDEIMVEIERGKTLVVQCVAVGEMDGQGQVPVIFELNGQPRRAQVPDRSRADQIIARPKADAANDAHVGAPMPGVVSQVQVAAGETVEAGDVLLSIEAMKMETAIHAETDGTIRAVHVKAGDGIDAKDLLVEMEA